MKKYAKIVQCDKRGQIIIPKDVRLDLGIEEGSGFFLYTLTEEGILLKKIDNKPLKENQHLLDEIDEKSERVGIKKENIKKSIDHYDIKKRGNFEEL